MKKLILLIPILAILLGAVACGAPADEKAPPIDSAKDSSTEKKGGAAPTTAED